MEFAAVLAQEYDAHLTGIFMRPAPAVTPPEMFVRGMGIPRVIEARQAEVEGIEANHRAGFDDIVRRNALGSEWRSVPYFSCDAAVHARYADLAGLLLSQGAAFGADRLVMGAYAHARLNELIFGGVTRTALHDAGLPVLMSR